MFGKCPLHRTAQLRRRPSDLLRLQLEKPNDVPDILVAAIKQHDGAGMRCIEMMLEPEATPLAEIDHRRIEIVEGIVVPREGK